MCYVILGNSAAAVGAVEGIREKDKEGRIIIISQENSLSYARPLISYYLGGRVEEKDIYYRPHDFYLRNNIETFLGEKGIIIDADKGSLYLKEKDVNLHFSKLLIATGGKPYVPAFVKEDFTNIFFFHSLDDVKKIDQFIKENGCRKAVVIGGGLIGLKAAESLVWRGIETTVIEAAPYILNSILDAEAADIVKKHLELRGISILPSSPVSFLQGDKTAVEAVLENNKRVKGDIFIIATGIAANHDWLKVEGLRVNRGIEVDEYMETSLPGIYAAGDVAEAYELVSGEKKMVPIMPNAYLQGRTAGLNMAGEKRRFPGSLAFNSLPLLGLNIVTAGLSYKMGDGYEVIAEKKEGFYYKKFVYKEGFLVGFILLGDISRCGLYRYLIAEKVFLGEERKRLIQSDVGFLFLEKMGIRLKGEKFYADGDKCWT